MTKKEKPQTGFGQPDTLPMAVCCHKHCEVELDQTRVAVSAATAIHPAGLGFDLAPLAPFGFGIGGARPVVCLFQFAMWLGHDLVPFESFNYISDRTPGHNYWASHYTQKQPSQSMQTVSIGA